MKLHQKLFIHALFGHLIISFILYFVISYTAKSYFENFLLQNSERESRVIFDTLYIGMLKGFNQRELDGILKNFQRDSSLIVNLVISDLNQKEVPLEEKEMIKKKGEITYRYFLKAKEKCLQCHQVKRDTLLGILEIKSSYLEQLNALSQRLIIFLISLSLFILLGVYLIGRFQAIKIKKALIELEKKIESANQFEDLIQSEGLLTVKTIGIEEIEAVNKILDDFIGAVKKLAVDKEVFYFQLSLLEKFIITSELVKDWKYYILKLLEEINKILDIPFIFALFYVEDEIFEADIFWLKVPTEELKKEIEEKLKKISKETLGKIFINFDHHFVYNDEVFESEDSVNLRIKKMILESPSIGGVVGVGISYSKIDYTKEIAIDAVLSSLLNVVGSVKAIYNYTKQLEFYATRDPLTQLYNQRVFWDFLDYEIERAKRYNYKFALLIIDLDNFKMINDHYGHAFGDKFLIEIASILEKNKRKGDILARYGGDEFTFILPLCDLSQAVSVAERIRERVNNFKMVAPDGKEVNTTISVGITIFPDHAETPKDLFVIADTLMYKAKKEGKNKIVYPSTEEILTYQREISGTTFLIKDAIEKRKILPYFQPIYELKENKVIGYEVLMRIETDEEILPASRFINLAETLGLITEMDFIVMEKALEKAISLNYQGLLFFNLSPKEIIIPDFLMRLRKLIDKYNFPRKNIIFEITERETVKNLKILEKFLKELQEYGFSFCIDDFGSGFSSYQYIKHFLINYVKIEGEFIMGLSKNTLIDLAIIESIVALCKRLNIKIVAESIESEEILKRLQGLDIEYGQGFYLGKPSPDLL